MNIEEALDVICESIAGTEDKVEAVQLLNAVRRRISEVSPMRHHPVDFVEWIPNDGIRANDYNPNTVAGPEMELLRLSVDHDGYTQPIVTFDAGEVREVVDGFHRNRVGRECPEIAATLFGFLPAVQIRSEAADRSDRMASTVRHNRARGKHQVVKMSEIVLELKRRNWSDSKVAQHLGMDPDEVLRLTQITGLAEAFKNREFSEAWEHTGPVAEETSDDGPVPLEWVRKTEMAYEPGWRTVTEKRSILHGDGGRQLGMVQKSQFKEEEWFWYAYLQPPQQGRENSLEAAQAAIEQKWAERA